MSECGMVLWCVLQTGPGSCPSTMMETTESRVSEHKCYDSFMKEDNAVASNINLALDALSANMMACLFALESA